MKISIFGLGYVGCVSLGCLAKNGYQVIGVDISSTKVNLINQGKPTIIERDIDTIISEQYKIGTISATDDFKYAIRNSDLSIICVGTPSTDEGHLNLDYIYNTAKQIGEALNDKSDFHTVAIRSTVLPGTNQKVGEIIESVSNKKRNVNFSVVSNPEFLREGTAVMDYFNPPYTVVGTDNDQAMMMMKEIYSKVGGSFEAVDIQVAETIKYVNNSYHALKVVFANEVGNICKKLKIDSHEVMRLFCLDTQLNISPYYFKPGFAYGGSCLPKDLKALKTLAHDYYLETPVLNAIELSNTKQKELVFNDIVSKKKKRIGVMGISFKAGTDDLRYSPIVEVIEKLLGKGFEIKVYDENVNISKLIGKNKSFIEEHLPHLDQLLSDNMQEIADWSDIVILTNKEESFEKLNIDKSKIVMDLVRFPAFMNHENYEGTSW
ncbi:MAG: nucleotide sugar dehydrogenase [Bacteroidales bacterium]|nr:nucleotide sugar dehydrogenase [Bacteroidales bacterium]